MSVPNLKQAIVAALSVHAPTVAMIGQNFFPVVIPQTTNLASAPALTYKVVTSLHDMNIAAASGMRSTRIRFRISSFAHGDIESCLEILRNLLQGFKSILAGLPIVFVTLENEFDGYDEPIPGSDLGTHYKEFDFLFKLRESIPSNAFPTLNPSLLLETGDWLLLETGDHLLLETPVLFLLETGDHFLLETGDHLIL
jgi:hypothetical protein